MKKAVKAAKGTAQVVWLGLATLVGVAALFKLAPMLMGGLDAPETATVVETDPMAEPGEPVTVVDQGSWLVVEGSDPMDDSPIVLVSLDSHDTDDVRLTVGCQDNATAVLIR